ncbi:MAG TPA: uracil-DNA glycosylase [Polyangiales bacterium]
MTLPNEITQELRLLLAAARGQLEVEAELGLAGVSGKVVAPTAVRPMAGAASTAPVTSAAPEAETQPAVLASQAAAAPEAPAVTAPAGERRGQLLQLATKAAECTTCVLHQGRSKSVFSRGSDSAELVFVGEGPGRDEDLQGEPFVGKAGQLLDKMIVAMGYGREEVYICNVVKCRPPENRTPRPEEALACRKFLAPQLQLVGPKVIVALGRCAAQALGAAEATGSWRGRWSQWEGIPVLSTYHPAFLLRSPEFKRTVWEDLQLVMARLGKAPAPKRS